MATVNKNDVYWLEQISNILATTSKLPVLTVDGTFLNSEFIPNAGQPTFAEAAEHYLAGGTVFLKVAFSFDEGEQVYTGHVVGHYTTGKLYIVFPELMNTSGGSTRIFFWKDSD